MNSFKRILVTGAGGFIGKNLIANLRNKKVYEIYEFDKENNPVELENFAKNCDLVFHLAGINRPDNIEEFWQGNLDFTLKLVGNLKKFNNKAPVIFTSSIQAKLDNQYGKSKLAAETSLIDYSNSFGVPVRIYRLNNVFGKWCRPSYNSVVATFCYNISRGLPIQINDLATELNLIYIDDVINELLRVISSDFESKGVQIIDKFGPINSINLGDLAETIKSFSNARLNGNALNFSDPFMKELYATYISYLPPESICNPLKMNIDGRGSFTEFLKSEEFGQISVNISKPGIIKGNHWHNTKNEKFLVVNGTGIIRLRKIGLSEIDEYKVSEDNLTVVDIPPGYTHNIENLGDSDMVTIIWANEPFVPETPDTFYEEV